MVSQNGSQPASRYVILAKEQVAWLTSLQQDLDAAGFSFVILTLDEIEIYQQQHTIDAIVLVDDATLPGYKTATHNPLMIRVTTNGTPLPTSEDAAQAEMPFVFSSSPNLASQITTYLTLHKDNRQLQETIEQLQAQIDKQHRTSNEVEILKNAIVRNVSHELRTPLLQVKSAVTLIGEDVSDKTLVNFAEKAMARLEMLVKNITMYGQSLDLHVGPIILRDSVEFARRSLIRVWGRRNESDRIQLKLEDNLPPVLADKQGLSTVMQLLMDNALKFSKDQPIEVIGCLRGDHVYIAVRDYGIGIAEDKLQDIFESFYQVDSSSTRRYGGMGIGLALVKLILDHHNTEIHVDSELGKGSTFWFLLPWVDLDNTPGF